MVAGKVPCKAERKIFFSALPLFKRLLKFLNELFQRVANDNDDCGSDELFQGEFSPDAGCFVDKPGNALYLFCGSSQMC